MAVSGAREVAPDVYLLPVGRGPVASNVYLVRSHPAWVLIDCAWAGSAAAIRSAAESLFGPGTRPEAILLTHVHPDHSGSAGHLARVWQVPVYAHAADLPLARGEYLPAYGMPLDRWVVVPLLRLLPRSTRRRITAAGDITDVTRALDPEAGVPGLPGWQVAPAPGHTPGSVAYLRTGDGVLASGDAVLTVDLNSLPGVLLGRQRLAGPPRYTTWNRRAAQRSISALAELEPRVIAPGHGDPLAHGAAEALRALARHDVGRAGRRTVDRLLVPLGDPGAARYRPPPRLYARLQWLGFALTRLGLSPRYVVTLEVPGRRSGVIRRTNVVLADHDGTGYLVSLTGESEWVRNVRAAGGRVVLGRRGQRRAATLVELASPDRPPVIRSWLLRAGRRPGTAAVGREARADFGVGPDLDLTEIAATADRFPVFRVVPDGSPGRSAELPGRPRACASPVT
ncbi:nitroreductase/quinone reductase family protein [Geodermatophilus sp. SYSU D00766]